MPERGWRPDDIPECRIRTTNIRENADDTPKT